MKRSMLKMAAIIFFAVLICGFAGAEPIPQVPVKDMVTMVDIGAKKCIPCKMMAPIMAELEKEYKDRAAVIFIDVWENPNEGRKFGIQTIPTQIFYDKTGKEVWRHVGFLDKKTIVAMLEKLGVK
jgi:thioredoxin 1